jgi:hypothetical protein
MPPLSIISTMVVFREIIGTETIGINLDSYLNVLTVNWFLSIKNNKKMHILGSISTGILHLNPIIFQ